MAVNLESIRRAYAGKYNVKGDVSKQLSIKYLNQVPGAIQELAKEEASRKEQYYKDSPDLEPFKGYNANEIDFVLSKKKEWDEAARMLSKRNISEQESLELTKKQREIEDAIQMFKDETDFYLGKRKEIIRVGNNVHPLVSDEDRIIFNRFVTNDYRLDREIDFTTGKSKWGKRVEEDALGNISTSYDIEDIYTYKEKIPKVSESSKKSQAAAEKELMKFTLQEENKGLSRDVSEENIRTLANTLYSKAGVWTGQYIDNFVEDVYARAFEGGFGETNLYKQIIEKDPEFFTKLSQIKDQETAINTMKNMLKKVDIKEDWVDFNTRVRMEAWDAIRADKEKAKEIESKETRETPAEILVAENKAKKAAETNKNAFASLEATGVGRLSDGRYIIKHESGKYYYTKDPSRPLDPEALPKMYSLAALKAAEL